MRRFVPGVAALLVALAAVAHGQNPPAAAAAADTASAIDAPGAPLPPESTSAGVTRFSFIAYGDTRGGLDGLEPQYDHRLVVESMIRTVASLANGPDPVRFVTWSGDAVVDGRVAQQWNVSFVGVVNRLIDATGLPFFPAPGNHDVAHTASLTAPGRIAGLRNYFPAFRKLMPADGAPRRLAGYPTFAVGYGNTFVVLWDTSIADDTTQYNWIRGQLEGLDRRRYVNIVMVGHHPAFSSGYHGGAFVDSQTAVIRARFMPLFRKHHVRLMLAGHEHLFEHWVERYQDASGAPHRLDQIVSGGGGAPLYGYNGEPDLREYIREGAAEKVAVEHLVKPGLMPGDNPYHYVVVHVNGERISVEVRGVGIGSDFAPYRSRGVELTPPAPSHSP
jgi:hypothetical protein